MSLTGFLRSSADTVSHVKALSPQPGRVGGGCDNTGRRRVAGCLGRPVKCVSQGGIYNTLNIGTRALVLREKKKPMLDNPSILGPGSSSQQPPESDQRGWLAGRPLCSSSRT